MYLNLVYDDWEINNENPNPNGQKYFYTHEPSSWRVSYKVLEDFDFNNYKNFRIEDIIKYPNENFYYLQWFRHSYTNSFFSKNELPLTNEVIELLKSNKNLKIIFINQCESESKECFIFLDKILESRNLDPNQFWIINNNSNLSEFKKNLNSKINTHTSRASGYALSNFSVNFIKEKENLFLCHNKSLRVHRYALLVLMKKYNLLYDTDWSLVDGVCFKESYKIDDYYSEIFTNLDMNIFRNEMIFFSNINRQQSKYELDFTGFNDKNQNIPFIQKSYENSYFNITTETKFNSEDIHITEKSFKPFCGFQFPLILASKHHIRTLKEIYDFDFFDDIINHSYDNISNSRDRLFKFVEEVKRIQENKDFFINFYKNNQKRFEENLNKIKKINLDYDITFFNNLITQDIEIEYIHQLSQSQEQPQSQEQLQKQIKTENLIEQQKINDFFNLVYDNFNDEKNYPNEPNCKKLYTNCYFMPIDSVVNSLTFPEQYIKRFKLSDVEKYPDKKFFYFITLLPGQIKEKIDTNQLPMPQEVIDYWKKFKNLIIVIMNEQESETEETFITIHNWTKSMELDQNQLWISNNNSKLEEFKKSLNSNINTHSTVKLANSIAAPIISCIGQIDFKIEKEGKFFMCQNRKVRPHRYGLLVLLKKYNILNDVDWSLVNGWEMKNKPYRGFYSNVFNEEDMDSLLPEIFYFNNIDQKKSKYETEYNWFDNRDTNSDIEWNKTYDKRTFENSYFNITTETEFNSNLIHISEKSFKAFYALQFPLILASPNHIQEIKKKYDFDFFDDVINHDYDKELNHRERLFKFANEIKRINENKDFFIKFYANNKSRFMENNRKIIEKSKDNSDLNFLIDLSGLNIEKR